MLREPCCRHKCEKVSNKQFSWTRFWHLVKFLTFPWQPSNSPTYPDKCWARTKQRDRLTHLADQAAFMPDCTENCCTICCWTSADTGFTVFTVGAAADGLAVASADLKYFWKHLPHTHNGCVGTMGWLRSTVGRTPVFGRRTDPVLSGWVVGTKQVQTVDVSQPICAAQQLCSPILVFF